jgi:hypothetical protein
MKISPTVRAAFVGASLSCGATAAVFHLQFASFRDTSSEVLAETKELSYLTGALDGFLATTKVLAQHGSRKDFEIELCERYKVRFPTSNFTADGPPICP